MTPSASRWNRTHLLGAATGLPLQLQGPQKIPLLLRLYHHKNLESWQWTLDQALLLHRQGHGIAIALVQDRRAIREPKGWRQMVALAFDRAHSFADFFEIGHAVNRSKWGVWDFREYLDLLQPVRAALIEYPNAKITGPACIDFEPHALGALLDNPRDLLPRPLPTPLRGPARRPRKRPRPLRHRRQMRPPPRSRPHLRHGRRPPHHLRSQLAHPRRRRVVPRQFPLRNT